MAASDLTHVEETGINIGGKGHWLHCVSNKYRTCYYPHKKRGTVAMNNMGILFRFKRDIVQCPSFKGMDKGLGARSSMTAARWMLKTHKNTGLNTEFW